MLNSYTAPIASAVNSLQTELASVKCRLPETVTLPANNSIAVPVSGITFNGGWSLGNCGWNNWNSWNNCSCANSLWG